MAKGKKTGGRVKGTPNKRSQEMIELARQLGLDPISGQLELAAWAMAEWRDHVSVGPPVKRPTEDAEQFQARQELYAARLESLVAISSNCLAKAAPYIRPRLAVIDARQAGSVKTHEEALAELEAGPDGRAAQAGFVAAFGDDEDDA